MEVILMGPKKSGKSSIQKVVFQKMTPNETKFIESSSKVESLMVNNNSFIQFIVRDFPGSFEFTLMSQNDRIYFQNCKILVFIIDAQDEPYQPSVRKCVHSIKEAYKINDKMSFKVFIHKTDGDMFMSEDLKLEAQRSIVELLRNELEDSNIPEPPVFMTSIYDHSIFVALSLVVQNLSPQVDYLQNMLDILLSNCRIDKIYLFDVISKLYIATDSTPVDMVSYELCSDMIDVIIDVSCIYGMGQTGQGFDGQSSSLIKLDNGLILYLREIHSLLALVCLIKDENFDRQYLIDYNIDLFKEAAKNLFQTQQTIN